MYKANFTSGGEEMFYHTNARVVDPNRPTIVFLHGLGETGESFTESFQTPELCEANLIAPDLIGFGHSTAATDGDYSFERQIARLEAMLAGLGIASFSLGGHSMGGDLATLMASRDREGRIAHLVNIEGVLTEDDQFLTHRVLENESRFSTWFPKGIHAILEADAFRPSVQRYFAALELCEPEAILTSAREIAAYNAPPKEKGDAMGRRFAATSRPKLYCFGDSLPPKSRRFLDERGIDYLHMEDGGHWIMIDRADIFYPALAAFTGLTPSRLRHAS